MLNNLHVLTLLYSNSSANGIEYNRMSVLHPVVDFCHRDPNIIVPFRYIVLPSDFVVFPLVVFLLAGSRVLYSEELLVPC